MELEKEKGGGKARLRGASKEEQTPQGSVKLSGQLFANFKASVLNEHLQTPMVSLRFHFRGAFVINSLDNFTLKLTFSPKFTGLTTLWNFPRLHMLLPAPLPVFSSGSFSHTLGDNADMLWDSSSAFSMHTTLP